MSKNLIIKYVVIGLLIALGVGGAGFLGWFIYDSYNNNKTETLKVYTSFYVLYDFAKKIGGNKVEVINILSSGEDAHHFELTTKQMSELNDADLILINGLGFESWIEDVSSEIFSKIITTSAGTTTIEIHEDELSEEEEESHTHHGNDPHIWLNLDNAKKQMENIKNALINIDPSNTDYYQLNYNKNEILIDGLKEQYTQKLNPLALAKQTFVVSHRAFGYIAETYNLNQISLNGIDSEEDPDQATINEVINTINNEEISIIFYQTLTNLDIMQTIAENTNSVLRPLSTFESLTEEEKLAGEDYFSLMARNLVLLEQAMS